MYRWSDEEMQKPEPSGNDFIDAYNLGYYACYLASKQEFKGIEQEASDARSKRWKAESERDNLRKVITELLRHKKTSERIGNICQALNIDLVVKVD